MKTSQRIMAAGAALALASIAFPMSTAEAADRYLHNSFAWGSATLDLRDADFSVCDKKAEGDPVYVVFSKTYSGDGQTVYDGNGSKPGCTTGTTSTSNKYMRICKSDAGWDTCSETGIRWW